MCLKCTTNFQFLAFIIIIININIIIIIIIYHNHYKKGNPGSCGIRTHVPEETGALNQRLRPLGHATGHWEVNIFKCNDFAPKHKVKFLQLILVQYSKGNPEGIGSFLAAFRLCVKASLHAKPFISNEFHLYVHSNSFSYERFLHEDSCWKRDASELGNRVLHCLMCKIQKRNPGSQN